jgi:hypothetical protein
MPPIGVDSARLRPRLDQCLNDGARCRRRIARWSGRATVGSVTAKEQLLERARGLSEAEAAEALRLLDARADPLTPRREGAPPEDEEISPEEEAPCRRRERSWQPARA